MSFVLAFSSVKLKKDFCVSIWVQSYYTCSQECLVSVHQTLAMLDSVHVICKHPDFSSHAEIPDTQLYMIKTIIL